MNFINGIIDLVTYFIKVIVKFDFFVYIVLGFLLVIFFVRIFKKFTHF